MIEVEFLVIALSLFQIDATKRNTNVRTSCAAQRSGIVAARSQQVRLP